MYFEFLLLHAYSADERNATQRSLNGVLQPGSKKYSDLKDCLFFYWCFITIYYKAETKQAENNCCVNARDHERVERNCTD